MDPTVTEHWITGRHDKKPWIGPDGEERQHRRVQCACGCEGDLLSRGNQDERDEQVVDFFFRHVAGREWSPIMVRPQPPREVTHGTDQARRR